MAVLRSSKLIFFLAGLVIITASPSYHRTQNPVVVADDYHHDGDGAAVVGRHHDTDDVLVGYHKSVHDTGDSSVTGYHKSSYAVAVDGEDHGNVGYHKKTVVPAQEHDHDHGHDHDHDHDHKEKLGASYHQPGQDDMATQIESSSQRENENANNTAERKRSFMTYLNLAGEVEDVALAVVESLRSEHGKLLLEPVAGMVCQALEPADKPAGCDVDAAVDSVQRNLQDIDDFHPSQVGQVVKMFDEFVKALTKINGTSSEAEEIIVQKIAQALQHLQFLESSEIIDTIRNMYKRAERKNYEGEETTDESLLYGFIRLFLSDRNLEKAVFQALCRSHAMIQCIARHFHAKYGKGTELELTESIHKMLQDILGNWDDRQGIFDIMKSSFNALTGKNMPLNFFMYDALVQGIKSGEVEYPAVLGYMEMAKVDPIMIEALANYDKQAFTRIKYVYVPFSKYILKRFAEDVA